MRQTNAVTPPHLLFFLYCCGVTALPFAAFRRTSGHCKGFVVCHTACSSASFVTAAPVSFAALHSSAPHYASFHLVRSTAICSLPGPRQHSSNIISQAGHQSFENPHFKAHWVPFRFVRRYFISVLLSPPAAHYLARRLSPLRLRSACDC